MCICEQPFGCIILQQEDDKANTGKSVNLYVANINSLLVHL